MKIVFIILILTMTVSAQWLNIPTPLAKNNRWINWETAAWSPNTSKYCFQILDSTVTINNKNYFILEGRDIGNYVNHQYLRYDSTENFYKLYDSVYTENGHGEEFNYYRKNLKIGDQWTQKRKYDNEKLYFSVIDTFQTSFFGKPTTLKLLYITDSVLVMEGQTWSDDLGLLKHEFEGGVDYLVGCIIDGVIYGDTTFYTTDVEKQIDSKPHDFVLYQNYPNPFNPTTCIKYSLPKFSHVTLIVYDILGKEIETLVDENKSAGTYEISFNGKNLSSGIYIYRIKAGNFCQTKKLILLK